MFLHPLFFHSIFHISVTKSSFSFFLNNFQFFPPFPRSFLHPPTIAKIGGAFVSISQFFIPLLRFCFSNLLKPTIPRLFIFFAAVAYLPFFSYIKSILKALRGCSSPRLYFSLSIPVFHSAPIVYKLRRSHHALTLAPVVLQILAQRRPAKLPGSRLAFFKRAFFINFP